MAFVCDSCGLERLDEDKHAVIDGTRMKNVCSRCIEKSHVILSPLKEEEVNKRLLLAYKPRRFGEKLKLTLKPKTEEDEFRRKIRMMRIEQGITLEQLSALIGINKRDLESFEKGVKEDLYIRKKLIDFFNLNKEQKFTTRAVSTNTTEILNEDYDIEKEFENGS